MTDEEIQKQLKHYFPRTIMSLNAVSEALVDGDVLVKPDEILRYLQSALLDDKTLEVEHDGLATTYFTRMIDDAPPEPELEEGEEQPEQEEYNEGDFLLKQTHVLTLPVEPGIGNMRLKKSKTIVLRMSTSSFDVEFGTNFESQVNAGGIAVLRMAFPPIARLVHITRENRSKVIDGMAFKAVIELNGEEVSVRPVNISISGMSLSLDKHHQRLIKESDVLPLTLSIDDEEVASLATTVRHLARIRKNTGVEYLCGVDFDMGSRASARAIESTVAAVQRAHLKELADKSDASGIKLVL